MSFAFFGLRYSLYFSHVLENRFKLWQNAVGLIVQIIFNVTSYNAAGTKAS